jgi:hypothetical protein
VSRRAALAAAIALALAGGCAHRAPPPAGTPGGPPPAPSAAELPQPEALPPDFTVRQKLTATTAAHGGGSFEAVLQKQAGKLTLVGIAPYGSRAFVLEQQGGDVKLTNYTSREPPFPPNLVLLDVYRVFGAWLGPPPAAGGERDGVVRGERIHERWRGGRLVERTFTRADGNPPGAITVGYAGADAAPGVAEDVTLQNARYGYSLKIHTLATAPK